MGISDGDYCLKQHLQSGLEAETHTHTQYAAEFYIYNVECLG